MAAGDDSARAAGRPPFDPEGPESEWKERLPRAERIARTMSAFANGVGGRIWVGVRDDGTAIGVADAEETTAELRRIARDLVAPAPAVEVRTVRFDGMPLVVAEVRGSDVRPVLAPGRDGELAPFVRDGSSTRPAPRGIQRVWSRGAARVSLDARERRLLREIRSRAQDGAAGPELRELARVSRMGQRAARRALVRLQASGLVTERTAGHFGLTPEGHARARRR